MRYLLFGLIFSLPLSLLAQVKVTNPGPASGAANTPTWVSASQCNMGGYGVTAASGNPVQLCWLGGRSAGGNPPAASGVTTSSGMITSTAGVSLGGCTVTGAGTEFPRVNCP